MKTVWKLTLAYNYEKEEAWLNEMSQKGYQLHKPGLFRFQFTEGEPGKYQYALEYLDASGDKMKDYFAFLEDTGIEIISQINNWAYYRKLNDGKPFEIFNDAQSKIEHFKRIMTLILILLFLNGWFMIDSWIRFAGGERNVFTIILVVLLTFVVAVLAYSALRVLQKIKHIRQSRAGH